MPDKDCLYVALYARGGEPEMPGREDMYHWAFILGPQIEPDQGVKGNRFHVKDRIAIDGGPPQSLWEYEERTIDLEPTSKLLVRIMIGKVEDISRLRYILQSTPIRAGQTGYDNWNCVEWLKEALELIQHDGRALGTSVTHWTSVRETAMWYVDKKKAEHRFDNRGQYDRGKVATWSMLDDKELIP